MSNETSVEQVWGNCAAIRAQLPPMLGWLDSPLLQQLYIQPSICGSPDGNWLIALIETLNIARDGAWLSIACGSGGLELFTAQQQLCATIEGVDIAPRAIALAQQHAHEQGLTQAQFRVQDLEHTRLAPNSYDVILCGMGLHHIRRLEYFYEEAMQALRPNGWLLLNEFVGPSQWQWTDTQLTLANALLAALPERYRIHALEQTPKTTITRPTIDYMNAVDASESIRSAELLPLLHQHFKVVHLREYGGAILHLLLEYIIGNFNPQDAHAVELLQLLIAIEQALMQTKLIGSDFAVAAAQNTRQSYRQPYLPFTNEQDRHVVRGVYALEQVDTPRPFCWTEAEAEFVLHCPSHARTLSMQVLLPPVERTLTIAVNHIPIGAVRSPVISDPEKWHWQDLRFAIPPHLPSQPSITISVEQAWSPARVLHNADPRELGIAIAQLAYQ